jgi:hypothetical protein
MAFWVVGCGLALSAGAFLSVKLVEKWNRKPMFVSFDTVPTPIWDIPFPAVTVCNVQEAKKSMASVDIDKYLRTITIEKFKRKAFAKLIFRPT